MAETVESNDLLAVGRLRMQLKCNKDEEESLINRLIIVRAERREMQEALKDLTKPTVRQSQFIPIPGAKPPRK